MDKTEQESFWEGKFGDQYINRNQGANLLASNLTFFSKALRKISKLESCIEFGANIGMNLKALQLLYPNIKLNGIEINKKASDQLKKLIGIDNTFNIPISQYNSSKKFDLSLIKGVLIHINPEKLFEVYDRLYEASSQYVLIAEYYNPSPVTVSYRGNSERLFKRDFAGEFLERFGNTVLIDYGFIYHKDPAFPQDDITWFLIEKK